MGFEQRDMNGVLFKNRDKQQDNHPDYKGSARIDGVDYFMDAWIKTNPSDNSKRLSVAFKRKDKQSAPVPDRSQQARDGNRDRAKPPKQPDAPPRDEDDGGDGIPF